MSPLRSIHSISDPIVRDTMRQLQRQIDELSVRVARAEANRLGMNPYTDVSRPVASSVRQYSLIFNTDDNFPNISDGNNWLDPTGSVT